MAPLLAPEPALIALAREGVRRHVAYLRPHEAATAELARALDALYTKDAKTRAEIFADLAGGVA